MVDHTRLCWTILFQAVLGYTGTYRMVLHHTRLYIYTVLEVYRTALHHMEPYKPTQGSLGPQ